MIIIRFTHDSSLVTDGILLARVGHGGSKASQVEGALLIVGLVQLDEGVAHLIDVGGNAYEVKADPHIGFTIELIGRRVV